MNRDGRNWYGPTWPAPGDLELVVLSLPCTVGMDARSGAQPSARMFEAHGRTVRPVAPKFAAAYFLSGKRGKNDAADAAATVGNGNGWTEDVCYVGNEQWLLSVGDDAAWSGATPWRRILRTTRPTVWSNGPSTWMLRKSTNTSRAPTPSWRSRSRKAPGSAGPCSVRAWQRCRRKADPMTVATTRPKNRAGAGIPALF